MNILQTLVGEGEKLTVLQMSVRAFVMFIITLVLIRFAGLRTFAKQSSFDNIIVIMLGAVLARGVVGASPFWSTVASSCCIGVFGCFLVPLGIENCPVQLLLIPGCPVFWPTFDFYSERAVEC